MNRRAFFERLAALVGVAYATPMLGHPASAAGGFWVAPGWMFELVKETEELLRQQDRLASFKALIGKGYLSRGEVRALEDRWTQRPSF